MFDRQTNPILKWLIISASAWSPNTYTNHIVAPILAELDAHDVAIPLGPLIDQLGFHVAIFSFHTPLQDDGDKPITSFSGGGIPSLPHLGGGSPSLLQRGERFLGVGLWPPPQIVWDIEVILWHRSWANDRLKCIVQGVCHLIALTAPPLELSSFPNLVVGLLLLRNDACGSRGFLALSDCASCLHLILRIGNVRDLQ